MFLKGEYILTEDVKEKIKRMANIIDEETKEKMSNMVK